MANITELVKGLWTGGDLPADVEEAVEHIGEWVEAGITHVVDSRIEYSDEELVALVDPSIGYLHNGADDAGQRMPDQWFDRAVDFTMAASAADPDAGVLVHCHMGINRGPSAAFAVLLRLGWDPVDASTSSEPGGRSPLSGTPRTLSTGGTGVRAQRPSREPTTSSGWPAGGAAIFTTP